MTFTSKRAMISALVAAAVMVAGLLMAPAHWGSLGIAVVSGVVIGLIQIRYITKAGIGILILSILVLSLTRRLSSLAFNLKQAEGLYSGYLAQYYGLALFVVFILLFLAVRTTQKTPLRKYD